jgi:hypothetical protein
MSDKKEPETQEILLLFLGRRKNPDGGKKKAFLWYKIDPGQNDGTRLKHDPSREKLYTGTNVSRTAIPGTVILIKASLDGKTVYPKSATPDEPWENREDVAAWNAVSRSVDMEAESENASVKKLKAALPAETLAPFRQAYKRLGNARQRAHLLAWVIEEITKYN